jgi:NADH-quinone oxidoreductase subunit N
MWFDGSQGATDHPPVEAKTVAVALALFTFPFVLGALAFIDPLAHAAAAAFGLKA